MFVGLLMRFQVGIGRESFFAHFTGRHFLRHGSCMHAAAHTCKLGAKNDTITHAHVHTMCGARDIIFAIALARLAAR